MYSLQRTIVEAGVSAPGVRATHSVLTFQRCSIRGMAYRSSPELTSWSWTVATGRTLWTWLLYSLPQTTVTGVVTKQQSCKSTSSSIKYCKLTFLNFYYYLLIFCSLLPFLSNQSYNFTLFIFSIFDDFPPLFAPYCTFLVLFVCIFFFFSFPRSSSLLLLILLLFYYYIMIIIIIFFRLSLQFDPAPRRGEPLVTRKATEYFLWMNTHTQTNEKRKNRTLYFVLSLPPSPCVYVALLCFEKCWDLLTNLNNSHSRCLSNN